MSFFSDLEPWTAYLVRTTWQVAVLVVLVLIVQATLGRRLSPRGRYALWLLVPLQLLLPAMPETPWTALSLTPHVSVENAVARPIPPVERDTLAALDATAPGRRRPERGKDPATATVDVTTSAAPVVGERRSVPEGGVFASPRRDARTLASEPASSSPTTTIDWIAVAWLLGAVLLAARLVITEIWFRGRLRAARPASPSVQALFEEARRLSGLRRPVSLLMTDAAGGPAVCGAIRPRVLFPPALAVSLSPAEMRHVFRHELAHLRAYDLIVNVVAAALACLHWPNPLVHFAVRRLRADQELARDGDVLASTSSDERASYGHTVLRVLDQRTSRFTPAPLAGLVTTDMKRRISMISKFDGRPRRLATWVAFGVICVSTVLLTGATSASRDGEARGQQDRLQKIRVIRNVPDQEWKRELREKLEREISCDFKKKSAAEVAAELSRKAECSFVLDHDAREYLEDEEINFTAEKLSIARILRHTFGALGLQYGLVNGVVYIGQGGDHPDLMEQRYYDVRPLLGDDDDDHNPEHLCDLVMTLTDEEAFSDFVGASISFWHGILSINQTVEVHALVEEVLNRLLNRGEGEKEVPATWRRELDQTLATTTTIRVEDATLESVLEVFTGVLGIPVYFDPELIEDDGKITLALEDVRVDHALGWVARRYDSRFVPIDGALRLTRSLDLVTRYYDVRDILVACRYGDDEAQWCDLNDLMRNSVRGAPWDEDGIYVSFWDGLFIVRQTPRTQEQIGRFLNATRTAYSGN